MPPVLKAGVCYFAIVFSAGFALGTVRTLLVVPLVGELSAVAIELPVILLVSWFACRRTVRRIGVTRSAHSRISMGAIAFVLLLIAEAAVSIVGLGRSMAEHLDTYRHASAMLGLASQLVYAAFPLIQANRE